MSHLLSTVNPAAAAAISGRVIEDEPAPAPIEQATASASPPVAPEPAAPEQAAVELPSVGDGVSYFPRPGELRAGKGIHAAIVTATNPEDQTLDLVVVYDADDFIGMRRVPARVNHEGMGWEPKPAPGTERLAALEAMVERLARQVFGQLVLADGDSLLGIIDEHEDRIETLENAQQTLKPSATPQAAVAKAARKKAKQKPKAKASARPTASEPAED